MVSYNSLTGQLPAALGALPALTRLELGVNQLDGSGVPAPLCAAEACRLPAENWWLANGGANGNGNGNGGASDTE